MSDAAAPAANEPAVLDIEPSLEPPPKPPRKPSAKAPRPPVAASVDFDRFWAAYPRKDNRANAVRAFAKAVKAGHSPGFLADQAERWASLWAAERRDRQYIPMPTTWLNGERWNDQPSAPRTAPNGHHPYANPADQSVWDEPLLGR